MSFNFRHTQDQNSCPINWAIGVPAEVTVEIVPTATYPRSFSNQELAALIHELGREGSLNPVQLRVLGQLPELAQTIAAE